HDIGRRVPGMAIVAATGPRRRAAVCARMVDDHRAGDVDHPRVAAIVTAVVAAVGTAVVATMVGASVMAAAPVLSGMAAVVPAPVVAGLRRGREGNAQRQ